MSTAGGSLIREISIHRFDVPLRAPLHISSMSLPCARNILVKVVTNDGVTGWGEASPFHSITGETQEIDLAAAAALKEHLLGRDSSALESRTAEMTRLLPYTPTIRGAFDIALHDIAARYAAMPLYRFLGGENRPVDTDVTIYLGPLEVSAARARELVAAGYRAIKVKLGRERSEDVERIRVIRDAIGPTVRLRIDANQAWDRVAALDMLRALERHDIEFCEQPCPAADHATLRHLSALSPIPVMADESVFSPEDALALDRADAVPYLNIKLSKTGGIRAATRVAAIAQAGGRPCMAGCMSESRLGITAAAHLVLAQPIIRFCDLDSFLEHREDPIRGGVTIRDGRLHLTEEPGIGATPDPAFLT